MIEVDGLTKRFGRTVAVSDLSFAARPGRVTGFLGPNGAGKTTTLRTLLGLVAPDAGTATVHGLPYRQLAEPVRTVGAVLEASSFHPGRSGRNHLRVLATAASLPVSRADELLALVELSADANRQVDGYSLGMRQRLGLAAALLGEPEVLVLDEPANGLDPQGIRWLRDLVRSLATGGCTVLISSHVLAEMSQVVDEVVIVHRGRLVMQAPVGEVVARASGGVRVRSPDARRLAQLLRAEEIDVQVVDDASLVATETTSERVGELAGAHGVVLHELVSETGTLEEAFLELTAGETTR